MGDIQNITITDCLKALDGKRYHLTNGIAVNITDIFNADLHDFFNIIRHTCGAVNIFTIIHLHVFSNIFFNAVGN
ncbi:hypothetical protein SDC9_150709 [bioreactor metagenome]|uniref:Uncharacterized protein n=1 Tax=bioreactor metagenome TaxID=1076179 RepID=A0A645EQQ7_9ZZZZ